MEEKTKRCRKCFMEKPTSGFSAHFKMADKLQSYCKDCCAKTARDRRIGKPCISCGLPKEEGVPKGAKICLKCAETCFECGVNPRERHHRVCVPCRKKRDVARRKDAAPEKKLKQRINSISSKYGVSRGEASELASRKSCEVCLRDLTVGKAHVDHCHESGKVRGVLCFNCNAALGKVSDDYGRLIGLVVYLSRSKGGIADLEKAKHYLEMYIELEAAK